MGTVERKQREKEQRRAEIISAAERVFFAKGFVDSSVDDIAREAELSKGTLYLYFANKDDLAAAVKLQGLQTMRQEFEQAAAAAESGIEKIGAIGEAFTRFFRSRPDQVAFMHQTAAADQTGPYARQCLGEARAAFNLMAEAIAAGQEDGTIRPGLNPHLTALALSNFSEGILQAVTQNEAMITALLQQPAEHYLAFAFDLMGAALQP